VDRRGSHLAVRRAVLEVEQRHAAGVLPLVDVERDGHGAAGADETDVVHVEPEVAGGIARRGHPDAGVCVTAREARAGDLRRELERHRIGLPGSVGQVVVDVVAARGERGDEGERNKRDVTHEGTAFDEGSS